MKKVLFVILVTVLHFTFVDAQTLDSCFVSAPDTIMPYVNKEARELLLKFVEEGKDTLSSTENGFSRKAWLSSYSGNHIVMHTSQTSVVEMALLPCTGDTLLCLIRTCLIPQPDSRVDLFTRKWEYVRNIDVVKHAQLNLPDTLSQEKCKEIRSLVDFKIVNATILQGDEPQMLLTLGLPFATEDEKKQINTSFLQRKLKWDGKNFK